MAGRRPDGFHEIETLMLPLELADEVRVARRDAAGVEFRCEAGGIDAGADGENLAYRAAEAFFRELGIGNCGARVELRKRIPSGAGLGGGSSDAAAVLKGLQTLFGDPLPAGKIAEIAASLGSDVPFFLCGGAAVCRGRGEVVEPCESPYDGWLLLVKPPFSVPTAWAYREHARRKAGARAGVSGPHGDAGGGGLWRNDLEEAVFSKYLLLAEMKRWLAGRAGVDAALLAGSGSTVFAAARGRGALEAALADFSAEFGEVSCGDYREGAFWAAVTRPVCRKAKS